MSKAVLVMEMPESCSKCQFLYEFKGIKKCQLMNVLYKGASMLSQNSFTARRHEKCPLRELPDRRPYNELGEITDKRTGQVIHETAALGWNAYRDAIVGEE